MSANLLARRRRPQPNRRVAKRELSLEPLEGRRLLATTPGFTCIEFNTELLEMDLSGGPLPMPLGSDPGDTNFPDAGGGVAPDGGLPSEEGYAFVDSEVIITLSSQRQPNPGPGSVGKAFAFLERQQPGGTNQLDNGQCGESEIDPEELDGEVFFVDSFFDVFFDITVSDVDSRPGRDFAGQPDGASISFVDNGPAHMQSSAQVTFDQDAPNFGLIPPPESAPYIGHFDIEIPLGGDINGNGEDDKIKFTLVTHTAGDENREFIELPDGSWIDTFDSEAFLEGAIVDESTDPPFTISVAGPVMAASAITGLKDPGFSYVDVRGNQVYDAGEDVALVAGEVEDGFFDTRVVEGGYTTVIAGAGLVINGDPISGGNLAFKSEGDLVVNTDLTASQDIRLVSRFQSVLLDDPTLTAGDDVFFWARRDIASTDDVIQATGNSSKISLRAHRDVALQGTDVLAPNGRSDIHVYVGRDYSQQGSFFQAGRGIKMHVSGNADASASTVLAGNNFALRAGGDIDATGIISEAGRTAALRGWGNVVADDATIDADFKVALISRGGNLFAQDAALTALTANNAQIRLHAAVDLFAGEAWLKANRKIFVTARGEIWAVSSEMRACPLYGKILVRAARWVDLSDTLLRAYQRIEVRSWQTHVNLSMASVAIVDGSTTGNVLVKADQIFVGDATIVDPNGPVLIGTQVGMATEIGQGTLPCELDRGGWKNVDTYTWQVTGPFDYYLNYITGTGKQRKYDYGDDKAAGDSGTQWGKATLVLTQLTRFTNASKVSWYEDGGPLFKLENSKRRSVVICPENVALTLTGSSTHTVEVEVTAWGAQTVVKIDGNPVTGCTIEHD